MKKLLMILGAALLLAGCGTGVIDSKTTFARDEIGRFIDSGELSGAIAIYYNDGVQETACLGYADFSDRRPISLDDHYMQCSQTKGFCGVTIAMLVESGKISLDDPVSKYLPEFKELWVGEPAAKDGSVRLVKAKTPVTIRMCMNHTAGFGFELPNASAMGGWARRMPLRSVAATAASQPLRFEPGTKVQYSNVGIDIGAAVVEVVTGKRWEDFLKERVLDPLGMTETTFWPSEKQLADKIEMYEINPGKPAKWTLQSPWMQRPYGDDRVFASAGAGLWTTARDQLKFYKMLMNLGVGDNGVRILREETVKSLLAKSTRAKELGGGGYSLGLNAPYEDGDAGWFGHGGAWCTQCSVNWHRRQLKLLAVQIVGPGAKNVVGAFNAGANKFFAAGEERNDTDAYTGRMQ